MMNIHRRTVSSGRVAERRGRNTYIHIQRNEIPPAMKPPAFLRHVAPPLFSLFLFASYFFCQTCARGCDLSRARTIDARGCTPIGLPVDRRYRLAAVKQIASPARRAAPEPSFRALAREIAAAFFLAIICTHAEISGRRNLASRSTHMCAALRGRPRGKGGGDAPTRRAARTSSRSRPFRVAAFLGLSASRFLRRYLRARRVPRSLANAGPRLPRFPTLARRNFFGNCRVACASPSPCHRERRCDRSGELRLPAIRLRLQSSPPPLRTTPKTLCLDFYNYFCYCATMDRKDAKNYPEICIGRGVIDHIRFLEGNIKVLRVNRRDSPRADTRPVQLTPLSRKM